MLKERFVDIKSTRAGLLVGTVEFPILYLQLGFRFRLGRRFLVIRKGSFRFLVSVQVRIRDGPD